MTAQRPKNFTSQQARKNFFVGRARQNAARQNTNPKPWQQFRPQSTGPAPPSSYPILPPTMQFQQTLISQEQAFEQFHQFHHYQSEQLRLQAEFQSEQLRFQSEQLRYHQDWSRQQFQNLFMTPAAVPPTYSQPVNQMPCQSPQFQPEFPVSSYIPRPPPWAESSNPPAPNTPQPCSTSQPHGQEPPILKDWHVYSSEGILNPDMIRCEEVDDDTSLEPSTTKTSAEASPACPPSSSPSSFSEAQANLKRKPSTESTNTLKKAKIDQMQRIDSETKPTLPKQSEPTVDNNNPNKTVRELNQGCEDQQSPGVDEASASQNVAHAAAEPQNNTTVTVEPISTSPPMLNPPPRTSDRKDTTMTSSTNSESRSESLSSNIKVHISLNSSIEDINSPRQVFSGLSKESDRRLSTYLELARCRLNKPGWENGVPLGDFVIVTKEHLDDLKSPEWYSTQTILAWRASLEIPSNWIVVVTDEDPSRHPISEGTTDIIRVNYEGKRLHWTLTHLSIKNWTVTYYDSYLGNDDLKKDDSYIAEQCDDLIHDMRREYSKHGITMPSKDPPISAQCTIRQYDSFSCGPFTLREAEKLLGFPVNDDQGCPLAIRCRHTLSILKAITKIMYEPRPSSSLEEMHSTSDLEEIPASKLLLKTAHRIENSTTSISQGIIICSNPELNHIIAPPNASSYPPDSSLHNCPSPELDYSTAPRNTARNKDPNELAEDDDGFTLVAARPSDEEIANLTNDQKRQAWRTLTFRQLRSRRFMPGLCKEAYVEEFLNDPLPVDLVKWNFLLPNTFAGMSRKDLQNISRENLRSECRRLGIKAGHTFKDQMIDKILLYNKERETGNNRAQASPTMASRLKASYQKAPPPQISPPQISPPQISPPQISPPQISPPQISPELAEMYKLCRQRNIQPAVTMEETAGRLREWDAKETQRQKLPKDLNFTRDYIDPHRPALIIILSRSSKSIQPSHYLVHTQQHAEARQCLEDGLILGRLENATYVDVYLSSFQLTRPLPLALPGRKCASGLPVLHSALAKAKQGTQVIFVAIGIDGVSCNEAGWNEYVNHFEITDPRKLQLFIVFAESFLQWHQSQILWSHHDWKGPIASRYWTCCPLRPLLNTETNVRLYQQIREQWTKCFAGRVMRRQGIKEEERPVVGRNGFRI